MGDRGQPSAGCAGTQGEEHPKPFTLHPRAEARDAPSPLGDSPEARARLQPGRRGFLTRDGANRLLPGSHSALGLVPSPCRPAIVPRGHPHPLRTQRREPQALPSCPPQRPAAFSLRGGPEPVPVPSGRGASRASWKLCGGARSRCPGEGSRAAGELRDARTGPRSLDCGTPGREQPGTGDPSQPDKAPQRFSERDRCFPGLLSVPSALS